METGDHKLIDFNAIDSELAGRLATLADFKSVVCGTIREVIPITQMPSLDVSTQGHETVQNATRKYRVPVAIVIRTQDYVKRDNASQFKDLVQSVCNRLEDMQGTSFGVVRDIKSRLSKDNASEGARVYSVTIDLTLLVP